MGGGVSSNGEFGLMKCPKQSNNWERSRPMAKLDWIWMRITWSDVSYSDSHRNTGPILSPDHYKSFPLSPFTFSQPHLPVPKIESIETFKHSHSLIFTKVRYTECKDGHRFDYSFIKIIDCPLSGMAGVFVNKRWKISSHVSTPLFPSKKNPPPFGWRTIIESHKFWPKSLRIHIAFSTFSSSSSLPPLLTLLPPKQLFDNSCHSVILIHSSFFKLLFKFIDFSLSVLERFFFLEFSIFISFLIYLFIHFLSREFFPNLFLFLFFFYPSTSHPCNNWLNTVLVEIFPGLN